MVATVTWHCGAGVAGAGVTGVVRSGVAAKAAPEKRINPRQTNGRNMFFIVVPPCRSPCRHAMCRNAEWQRDSTGGQEFLNIRLPCPSAAGAPRRAVSWTGPPFGAALPTHVGGPRGSVSRDPDLTKGEGWTAGLMP